MKVSEKWGQVRAASTLRSLNIYKEEFCFTILHEKKNYGEYSTEFENEIKRIYNDQYNEQIDCTLTDQQRKLESK